MLDELVEDQFESLARNHVGRQVDTFQINRVQDGFNSGHTVVTDAVISQIQSLNIFPAGQDT